LLRDRRVARELVACHAKILGAADALSDHGSPRQVCLTTYLDIRSILSFLVCLCLGYTYAGQVIFDKEALSSTYPDFYPFCSLYCGNTCCVPSDEWDGARAAAGD